MITRTSTLSSVAIVLALLAIAHADDSVAETWPRYGRAERDSSTFPERRIGLTLRLIDLHELLPAGRKAVASEVTRIFETLGVTVRWSWEDDPDTVPPGHVLRVVLMPSAPSGPGWHLNPRAVGATPGDSAKPTPAVYVFYQKVLRSLGIRQRRHKLPSVFELRRMTRALGRVIAHEVFHALAPGQPHAETGLMSASLSTEILVGDDVTVDKRWTRLLLRRLEGLATTRAK